MRVEQNLCPPRYLHLEWVASGGMGDLYRAIDDTLGRPVAVKLLARRFATDEDVRRRFHREALTAARLSDLPNTVTIFDVGEWQGTPFIVMEYLGGGTLEQAIVEHGARPAPQVVDWLRDAAASLDAAHVRGVVHRDVKPANLLLDDDGHVRVVDFGIAHASGLDPMTLTGTVLGSAGYLAPEQAQGRPATAASDGYALGVVAFELLTGVRPYARDSYAAEASAHVYEAVPSAARSNRKLPAGVDDVLARALAKDPVERFPTCAAFVSALAASTGASVVAARPPALAIPPAATVRPTAVIPRRRSRLPLVLAALVALALAGLAGALLWRGSATHTVVRTVTRTVRIVASAPGRTVARAPTPAPAPRAAQPPAAADPFSQAYQLMLAGDYRAAVALLQRAIAGLEGSAGRGQGWAWGRAFQDPQG